MSEFYVKEVEASEFKEQLDEANIKSLQDFQKLEESKKEDRVDFWWSGSSGDPQLKKNETKEIMWLLKPDLIIDNGLDDFFNLYMDQSVYG